MSDIVVMVATGFVGNEPKQKQTKNGATYAQFSLGSSLGRDQTSWRTVNAYGTQAQFVMQYLHKGSRVHVQGEDRAYAYTAQDGTPRAALVIEASHVGILDAPRRNNDGAQNAGGGYANGAQTGYAQPPMQNQGYAAPQQAPVQQAPVQQNQGYAQAPVQQQRQQAPQQAQPRNGNYYDAQPQYAQPQPAPAPAPQDPGLPNLDISSDDLPF